MRTFDHFAFDVNRVAGKRGALDVSVASMKARPTPGMVDQPRAFRNENTASRVRCAPGRDSCLMNRNW
jgi:hypothetical protein